MSVAAYPKYDSYQAVSLPWCHAIPSHWHTEPIRNLFIESRKKNSDGRRTDYLSLMANRGIIPYAEKGDVGNKMPSDLSGCKMVEKNDFVLNSMNFGIGSFGVSPLDGICSSVYVILKAKDPSSIRYYERIFQHPQFQTFSQSLGNGILAHRCAIGWDEIKNAHFPYPPGNERIAIASFLDEKCAKIDEAVRIKEEQIARLRERRQILIQQAVTRGLDPDAPMKDSGIDWIGQIPAHWDAIPLKRLFRERNERTKTGAETLFSLRMMEGLVPHDDVSDKPISDVELIDYKKIHPGQIVMNRMRASIGLFGIAEAPGLVSPDYAIFDLREGQFAAFYLHLFKLERMGARFRLSSRGLGTGSSGFMRLYTDDFGVISVPVPNAEEQCQIVDYIDKMTTKFTNAIELKQQQIAALKEYKTSLINAAVTGKIKVI